MSAVTQMKQVFEGLAGRTLTNDQLESVTSNYNASWGNAWFVTANPYDKAVQPTEHAEWPENATAGELATFALERMREDTKNRLRSGRGARYDYARTDVIGGAGQEI
jgi:hypothetical protein